MKKLAYLPMAVDIVHPGHINIITTAASLGATVMVGCYSDKAIGSYKRLPFMSFEQRKKVIGSIKGVDIVVEQKTSDLEENIRKYKPDYVVHGTDWRDGALSRARERTIQILKEWGGELVEPEYTMGISSSIAHAHLHELGITPHLRIARLKKLFAVKPFLRGLGVYNPLGASIAEGIQIKKKGTPTVEFDFLFLDEQSIADAKGRGNRADVDFSEKKILISDLLPVTTKPLIYDASSEHDEHALARQVKVLETSGVSGIVIENEALNKLEAMVRAVRQNVIEKDFMVIPQISMNITADNVTALCARAAEILNMGVNALAFKPDILEYDVARNVCTAIHELAVPSHLFFLASSNFTITAAELACWGFSAIINTNTLLQSSKSEMKETITSILNYA